MLSRLRRRTARALLAEHQAEAAAWRHDLDALERGMDALWQRYRADLRRNARRSERVLEALDRLQWTTRSEFMDRPELSPARRARLLVHMDRVNRALGLYRNHLRLLRPLLREAAARRGERPVRLLDLASGRGGFARFLAGRAAAEGLALQVTGSDYQPEHVAYANQAARRSGCPATFRVLNAFRLEELETGAYDLVSCEFCLHHFRPGQLARVMREGARVATTAFLGIDMMRAPSLAPGVVATAALVSGDPLFVHDAAISARRFFHGEELAFIARMACPAAEVRLTRHLPGLNALRIATPA